MIRCHWAFLFSFFFHHKFKFAPCRLGAERVEATPSVTGSFSTVPEWNIPTKFVSMDLLPQHRNELTRLCQEHEVKSLYLFGSQAQGNAKDDSDIDLLVAFEDIPIDRYTDHYFELHEKLEELFGKPIDLVTVNMLGNPFFIESIESTKQLLYAA